MRFLLIACLPSLLASAVHAEELDFAPTRTVEGRTFAITGAGVKKDGNDKEYEMALYVDELDARRAFPALAVRAGGRSKQKLLNGEHAQSFVLWGHFSKLAEVRFLQPITADDLRAEVKDALDAELGDKAAPDLHKQADTLVALLDRDLEPGQTIIVRTDDTGHIELEVAGHRKAGPQSPKLVRALWGVWLGTKPVSKELSRSLVEKLDLLGR
jgi:hypothetical protein